MIVHREKNVAGKSSIMFTQVTGFEAGFPATHAPCVSTHQSTLFSLLSPAAHVWQFGSLFSLKWERKWKIKCLIRASLRRKTY